ncbi:virulence factor TspB C-terminal domain-related protein, partial [Pseudomonas sp. HY13-MNA-CIBAN-0226]
CDGDPFQCAILKQAHIDTCKLMAGPTDQEQADSDAKTDAAYADLDAHQTELDGKVTGLLSQFQSSTSGGGSAGKCLPDYQFAVAGHSIDMEFSKACDSLSWVRLVVLAGAYLFAARIVSREV